ncbi:MAG TPA: M14 family metallopeptidase [Cyclobacteriaceae bacterium]|nr:M14 family metallopeptidase [Cyclobacteriaceae bacterium]
MRVLLVSLCVLLTTLSSAQPGWPEDLLLVPEITRYEKTSTHADVMSFLEKQSSKSKNIRVIPMGKSLEGKDIPVAIVARPMVKTAEEAKASGKLIVYVQGNIHAGEVEGKEVVMMQIREILALEHHPFLDSLIILFVPIYNTDSNDRMVFGRRPSQENSPPDVGIRENSQGLDLNRDGMKMEAIETNGLFKIINEWDPQLFVDLHTTNGTWHGWDLTWAPSYHSAGEKAPYDFTVKMLKEISAIVPDKYGVKFGPFGDYDLTQGWPVKNFYTYNHHPRYLVNQFGLRNRMAILSEAFSHKPFKNRIYSTNAFVTEILTYAAGHASQIRSINKQAEAKVMEQKPGIVKKGVRYRMVPSEVLRNMPSYAYEPEIGVDGKMEYKPARWMTTLDSVVYYGGFNAEVEATIPGGYVIPRSLPEIAANLRKHGIVVEELQKKDIYSGDEFVVEKYDKAQRKFEGHTMARAVGKFVPAKKRVRNGDFIVRLSQPLGNLAFYLLEPESDDGLVAWNFFDQSIEKQKQHNKPIVYPVFKYYTK